MIPPDQEAVLRDTAATLSAAGVDVSLRQWPGTTHGFAVRGSDADMAVVTARAEAFAAAVAFFQQVL
jgi:dienelactone hydrolase